MPIDVGPQPNRRARLLGRLTVCIGAVLAAVLSVAHSAAAAPTCLQPLRDRYEPSDEVTVVGYGCVRELSGSGAGENLVAFGYLHVMPDPCAGVDPSLACNPSGLISDEPPVDPASGIPLGQITLEESPVRGLRASLTFRIPSDLAPGTYYILACGQPCAAGDRAYTTWPSPLYIGVDPPSGALRVRTWPLDDPAIDLLPDDALLLGPDGNEVTAAEVRAEAANDADRVETTASTGEARDDPMPQTLWIVAAALVLAAAGWVVPHLGRPRKRIRPGP